MSYQGWKNRQTWNVSLWINNDEGLYDLSRDCRNYAEFVERVKEYGGEIAYQTPDGVAWNDSALSISQLNRVIRENRRG